MKSFVQLLIVVAAVTSCQKTSFNRDSKAQRSNNGTQNPTTTTPTGVNPNGSATPIANNPIVGTGTDADNPYKPGGIFFDISDTFGNARAAANPFFVDFGGRGKIWHIGDSGWDGTACKAKMLFRFLVRAREFNFNFEVLEDGTNMTASLRYCGVDYVGSKFYIVGPGGNSDIRDDVPVGLTAKNGIFTAYTRANSRAIVLNKGWHKIRVVSMQNGTDLDNYLVGRVSLDPSKAVRLGDVTSN
jgi:hypothetical protein